MAAHYPVTRKKINPFPPPPINVLTKNEGHVAFRIVLRPFVRLKSYESVQDLYRFWPLVIFLAIFGYFRLSERYEMCEIQIQTCF